ncbi:MAG: sensor histidine kinase [Armatimonadota bacterium]
MNLVESMGVVSRARGPVLPSARKGAALARAVVLVTVFVMLEMDVLAKARALDARDLVALMGVAYVGVSSWLELDERIPERLHLPFLVADLLLITAVIYLAGGLESEYYPLYYLPILQASVRLNFRDAVSTSILAAALYAVLGCTEGFQVYIPTTAYLRITTFAVSALFMAAFFALLMREAREHKQKNIEMSRLLEEVQSKTEELASVNQQLLSKNEELERNKRELEETQAQLVASQKLAALGQLAGSVAHELRNPLGAIKNAAYFLRRKYGGGEEQVATLLSVIDQEIATGDRIISSLLDFCRAEPLKLRPTDVSACLEAALEKLEGSDGVSVVRKLPPDLPLIAGDASQLYLVFTNIIANAIQAMPEGGELRVEARSGNGVVEVAVHDTGVGIPEQDLERIFEPLYTTKTHGIGLGLVVCKTLVERHGGEIEVTSTPGQGSSFAVRLPVASAQAASGESDGQD